MPPILDADKCTGVGACVEICPTEVIDIETNGEGKTIAAIDVRKIAQNVSNA